MKSIGLLCNVLADPVALQTKSFKFEEKSFKFVENIVQHSPFDP